MSAQHTPGPWSVGTLDASGDPSEYYLFIEPGIAVIERKVSGSDANDMPDARLIAAAPDLLKVLQALLDEGADETDTEYDNRMYRVCTTCQILGDYGVEHHAGCTWEQARAAIAKATGSTS